MNFKKILLPAAVVAFALASFYLLAPAASSPQTPVAMPVGAAPEVKPGGAMPIKDTHADLIRVTAPEYGALVKSPLAVTGEARGNWYFEASFPVKLLDQDGAELANAPAQAVGDWMTADFVPFALTLPFNSPKGAVGTLVLKKDNPSGDPAKDDEVRIPVRFADVPITK